ncbi:MAG: hypothetical protein IT380_02970 [Myxococcales bacterium]|nr:hypothetical protein [Myxococcales bacterium]
MRHVILLSAVVLAACGGNWSTKDLEFVNALPQRADLQARLPAVSSSTQPLEGVSTRRDGLNVGDPSPMWTDTRKASTDFNLLLESMLAILDTLRRYPPTTRSDTTRVWGPFPDTKNEGFEFQVAIQQTGPKSFGWALQARPRAGQFFDVVTGVFEADASARQGQGSMTVHVTNFKDVLQVDPVMKALDQITVGYQTANWPHRVDMTFAFTPGNSTGLSAIGYTYRQQEDASGALAFQVRSSSAEATLLTTVALWNPQGAGKGQAVVDEGTYAGATVSECWNTSQRVVFSAQGWTGGQVSGVQADCVTIDGL